MSDKSRHKIEKITIRFSKRDRKALERRAKHHRRTVSDYIRLLVYQDEQRYRR